MGRYKFFIALTFLLISCAPSKKVLTDLNVELLFSKIAFRSQYIKTIIASGSITIDSPEFSNSANLKVSLKKPDTLTFKVEAIFGISVGEAKIYGDNFEAIDKFNDRIIRGKVDDYIRRYLSFDIPFSEIINILTASPQIDTDELQNFDENELVLKMRKNYGEAILKFDSELELESYTLIRDGNEIFEVRYSKYARFGEITLPRVVRIWDRKGRGIYLSFSEIKVNDIK